ncbi:MAG: peptide chain release factor-like protein [Planctomycetota bacterium]
MPQPKTQFVNPPHPATLDDVALQKQSTLTFGRDAGPGGQHRNKVETAACWTHDPTGISGTASERRKQSENRSKAMRRLRMKLAIYVRTNVSRKYHQPSELWKQRRQGKQISINPKHRDYPALLAEALDVIIARKFDVAGAAGVLGISMSQLAKLVRHDRHAFALVNEGRTQRGLPALK